MQTGWERGEKVIFCLSSSNPTLSMSSIHFVHASFSLRFSLSLFFFSVFFLFFPAFALAHFSLSPHLTPLVLFLSSPSSSLTSALLAHVVTLHTLTHPASASACRHTSLHILSSLPTLSACPVSICPSFTPSPFTHVNAGWACCESSPSFSTYSLLRDRSSFPLSLVYACMQ